MMASKFFSFSMATPSSQITQKNVPEKVWADFKRKVRIIDEPRRPTSHGKSRRVKSLLSFHELRADNCKQCEVGEGETLGFGYARLDKTHLNNTYGDKHIHGVYMSCGNIDKDIRTKLSARVWVMIAQIPVVKFLEKTHQGILTQRLLHVCMDFITANLKECSKNPKYMADAKGILRLIRTILLAHIADFPEQQAIACVSGDASPISVARHAQLGLNTCQALRKAEYTLSKIKALLDSGVSPSNLSRYKTEARKAGLNGVHKPYWRDWRFAEPSTFLTPDALHQWHIFFAKHPMMWRGS